MLRKIKDGFQGELQINIPREVVINQLRKTIFQNNLFIHHIGYFPNAKFHYRERPFGCEDNILIYCITGKGYYRLEDENFCLRANQFMLLPPGKSHSYQADIKDPWTIYWVHFSGDKLKDLNKWLRVSDFVSPTNISYDKKIIDQWNEIYKILEKGFTYENLTYANLCLYRLLALFLFPQHTIQVAENPARSISNSLAFMKQNINKTLTLNDLAKHMKYSVSHYTSLFKKQYEISPIEYFINLKVEYASQLLSQTELRVNEIAAKVGYDDSFYFSRLFRKITGKSPKDYRVGLKTKNVQA